MAERFLFFFALLGLACWLACYLGCRSSPRLRCLAWGLRVQASCAFVLYLLICYQPQSAISQAVRPPFESVIAYTHYVLFGSPIF